MSAQPIYKPQSASYGLETITPQMAGFILANCNDQNRPIRKRSVDFLASEITSGSWQSESADAICIDTDGNLVNGQHRLAAIVQSGIAVKMLVGRNVPTGSFQIIDRGIKRSTGDDVQRIGMPNANNVSAFVGNYLLACVHGSFDPYAMTSHKKGATKSALVTEFVSANFDICAEIGKNAPYTKALPEPRFVFATLLHLAMSGVPIDEVIMFLKMLNPDFSGDINNNHPARAASRTLLAVKLSRIRLSFGEISEIIIRAFNDAQVGETRQVKYHPKRATPQVNYRGNKANTLGGVS